MIVLACSLFALLAALALFGPVRWVVMATLAALLLFFPTLLLILLLAGGAALHFLKPH